MGPTIVAMNSATRRVFTSSRALPRSRPAKPDDVTQRIGEPTFAYRYTASDGMSRMTIACGGT